MGIDFAFIRIGYRRRQSGEIVEDAKYKEYIAGAQRAGIKVGAYFFLRQLMMMRQDKKRSLWYHI